jgi:hypothetical protein
MFTMFLMWIYATKKLRHYHMYIFTIFSDIIIYVMIGLVLFKKLDLGSLF